MNLAQLILSRFAGRADTFAVENGEGFAPEVGAMTTSRLERDHLSGESCLGFYVLDSNVKCKCTCVDFDNKPDNPNPKWKEQAEQLYFALVSCQLSPLVELSQSGNGCHVWLFFSEPTDAWLVRAWWSVVEARLRTTFVEVFPKQDQLTGKGLGNLVRYPLWNSSCFVDVETDWMPLDPSEALESVHVVSGADLKLISFQSGMGELKEPPRVQATLSEDGGAMLPLRVQKMVERQGTLLNRRWNNDSTGMKDTSRSAVAMSLSIELVRSYIPTSEIESALRYWCKKNGADKKGERDDWIGMTVAKAYDFILSRTEQKSVQAMTYRDACHAFIDRIERNEQFYVPSGIRELDESIDGVGPGEVAIIAGRPNHGKSAIGFQWIDHAASIGVKGLIISEEMGFLEIGKRRLLSISGLDQDHWVPASAARLRKEVDEHHEHTANVFVVEGCCTIDRVEEVIDQYCSVHSVGLVMVDYLQLLGARRTERYEVVTEVSRRIKQAARRNGVAILLLSQLNREVEKRDDNEPKMSDLRESGQIEQDADLILFAQYPCRFDPNASPEEYRIIAGKRRNGPIRQPRIVTKFNPKKQFIGIPELPMSLRDLND